MRIALYSQVSPQKMVDDFGVSRATAYRYVALWCYVHNVPGPCETHRSFDTLYSRTRAYSQPKSPTAGVAGLSKE